MMNTAHDLLLNTVFHLMGLRGALSWVGMLQKSVEGLLRMRENTII